MLCGVFKDMFPAICHPKTGTGKKYHKDPGCSCLLGFPSSCEGGLATWAVSDQLRRLDHDVGFDHPTGTRSIGEDVINEVLWEIPHVGRHSTFRVSRGTIDDR